MSWCFTTSRWSMKHSHIMGMEALLRWNHPELGLILPADFIRIMEETGIIVPVGRWVLQTACAQTKRWHDMGFPDLFVAVNLAARQLQEPDFVPMVIDIIVKAVCRRNTSSLKSPRAV
jgi:EAL domain-containing protein (putative c-di-GMP-specific phosphodiesterase class I)